MELYILFKKMVVPQCHIHVDLMEKNEDFFGEALDMYNRYSLCHIMEVRNNYDEKFTAQFYSTVSFGTNEVLTLKWIIDDRALEYTWVEFMELLGYPMLPRDDAKWLGCS